MKVALPEAFSQLVAPPVFGASGLLFLALAVAFFISTRRKLRRSTRVPGRVVGHEEMNYRTAARGTPVTRYLPIVEYIDRHGASRRTKLGGRDFKSPREGAEVLLLRDPDDPSNMELDSFFGQWWPVLVLGGLGALFLSISVGSFLTAYFEPRA